MTELKIGNIYICRCSLGVGHNLKCLVKLKDLTEEKYHVVSLPWERGCGGSRNRLELTELSTEELLELRFVNGKPALRKYY